MWNALTSFNYSRKRGASLQSRTVLSLTIREWNTATCKQVGYPLAGILIAFASSDSHVRLQELSDRRTTTTFQRSALWTSDVTIYIDDKCILSGGQDEMSNWAIAKDALPEEPASAACFR
ncbi:hypothetical protein CY34DRAFT_622758 [Suillus luteus UH-Slu-Lm8-n1]|uniref:Unplaced genomic scaffold CY34scaffold_586, whole genome shotgun sequence n=1 Tax=Suillus luteus UH-Slu-Lm8-n1 TaxID=930992 RepID=A0A0D0ARR9_9AGAM|nr:hypothetical protein CY34DRAFT_622758 [Suillus luteus UH-Slu-Lm8-n1]